MAQCPRCEKRPAKRYCPALGTNICAVCCARDRMIEIPCPESCTYLQQARVRSSERVGEVMLHQINPSQVKKFCWADDRRFYILSSIDEAIARTQRGALKDLEDSEILAALDNAIKNLETAGSGLIDEHKEPSPRVQELSVRIRSTLDEASDKIVAEMRPTRSEIVDCLRFERSLAEQFSKGEPDGRAYTRHLASLLPWTSEDPPRIIT